MLDKKQIWAIFLFEFKMGLKQSKQLAPSAMHLTQELLRIAVVALEVLHRR